MSFTSYYDTTLTIVFKPTIQPYKASQGLTPAQAQKKRVPIEDLFRGNATVVKTKKIVIQQALDTDSEVEIVEVNFNSKPSVALKGKSQPKLKVKVSTGHVLLCI